MTGRCTRWKRRSLRSEGRLKVLKLESNFFLAEEIIEKKDSFRFNSLGPLCLWQCFSLWLLLYFVESQSRLKKHKTGNLFKFPFGHREQIKKGDV